MSKLTAISPVDGRYQKQTASLSAYFSEFGLIKYRVLVEVHYFLFLADKKFFKVTPALRKALLAVVENFSEADAEKIKTIDKQMGVQRGNRGAMVRVALVGYTNVGKSTLMNAIGKSDVFVENKLFATLDTTVRKVVIKNLPFLLSDTVGFIRKLPTQLVDSFKSTLDEVREADLLLHVVDISHPEFEDHIESVNQTLADIKSNNKPTIMVFNKIDAYKHLTIDEDDLITEKTKKHYTLEEWKTTWMNNIGKEKALFISATNKENFEVFRERIYETVREIHITRFPYNKFLYPDYKDAIEKEDKED
jgi:GTP-binding protein HflX